MTKTFLIIEKNDCDRCEHDIEYKHIIEAETLEEALKQTYLDESIGEYVINMEPDEPWPTNVAKDLGGCYVPKLEVYEIEKALCNIAVKKALDTYLNDVLAKAVEEEKIYRAEAPQREQEAKIVALQKAAAELGMDITPKTPKTQKPAKKKP